MYIDEDKPEYLQCSDHIWKNALPRSLTPALLPTIVQLMIVEYSMLLTNKHALTKQWHENWAKWSPEMKEDEKKIFDCAQLVTRN
ncbi:13771_t:CDS:2, partial [Cetraspora pellucida]